MPRGYARADDQKFHRCANQDTSWAETAPRRRFHAHYSWYMMHTSVPPVDSDCRFSRLLGLQSRFDQYILYRAIDFWLIWQFLSSVHMKSEWKSHQLLPAKEKERLYFPEADHDTLEFGIENVARNVHKNDHNYYWVLVPLKFQSHEMKYGGIPRSSASSALILQRYSMGLRVAIAQAYAAAAVPISPTYDSTSQSHEARGRPHAMVQPIVCRQERIHLTGKNVRDPPQGVASNAHRCVVGAQEQCMWIASVQSPYVPLTSSSQLGHEWNTPLG